MFKPRRTPGLPIDNDNAHFKAKSKMNGLFSGRSSASRALIGVIVSLILLVLLVTQEGWSLNKFHSSGASVKPVNGEAAGANDGLSCTRSYDGKKPVTQYVVMVDAGSSGSRVHVYEFNNCKAMPRLIKEDFKMIDGGLSSFDTEADAAAHSLDVLLDFAKEHVPAKLHGCTPIAVKATAGLRKLGEEKSAKILTAVQNHLEKDYPFPVIENGVVIMPGEEEGVYAWVTANYLLGKIGTSAKDPTVAVFDLGGGSTQIVFEPTFADATQQMVEGEHKYKLSFGGREFVLYQHSYLGYGLNEARAKINSLIAVNQVGSEQIVNPCLPPGSTYTDKVLISDSAKSSTVKKEITFVGPKEPSPLQCRALAEKILEKDAVCANPPCAFNGVYQPALLNAFPNDSDMYVFSFFYDRTYPLGMPQSFSIADLKDLTNKVCEGPDSYPSFEAIPDAVKTLKANPQWCLDLSYMLSLLHTGYDIHSSREVRIAKKIANNELGWCLGASLPLLDGTNWKCQEVR